jgi:hypothetical protein
MREILQRLDDLINIAAEVRLGAAHTNVADPAGRAPLESPHAAATSPQHRRGEPPTTVVGTAGPGRTPPCRLKASFPSATDGSLPPSLGRTRTPKDSCSPPAPRSPTACSSSANNTLAERLANTPATQRTTSTPGTGTAAATVGRPPVAVRIGRSCCTTAASPSTMRQYPVGQTPDSAGGAAVHQPDPARREQVSVARIVAVVGVAPVNHDVAVGE